MKIKDAAELLNNEGIKVSYNNNFIKEELPPYTNYYQLEKKDTWEYGMFICERENNPYVKSIYNFDSEDESVKYFYLDRLSSYYFKNRIQPFIAQHNEFDIGGTNFSEDKLVESLYILSIPSSYLFNKKNKNSTTMSILVEQTSNTLYKISLIGTNGAVLQSVPPMSRQRALFLAFKKVYLLYIYDTTVSETLRKFGLLNEFKEEDVRYFL
jgi:hypothetical protein